MTIPARVVAAIPFNDSTRTPEVIGTPADIVADAVPSVSLLEPTTTPPAPVMEDPDRTVEVPKAMVPVALVAVAPVSAIVLGSENVDTLITATLPVTVGPLDIASSPPDANAGSDSRVTDLASTNDPAEVVDSDPGMMAETLVAITPGDVVAVFPALPIP